LWFFRALALVGIPALAFLGLEGGLRLAGYGQPVSFLIRDDKPGYFRTNPDFVSWFLPSNFDLRPLNYRVSERKRPNTVRIVVLGESAAQGIPVPAFAFAAQLRALLRARYPGRDFEVINTGIVAINSHVVYQVARELSRFSPDLFIVYMGNNEVVGPYGPGCAYLPEMPPLWVIRLSVFVRSTRTGQLVTELVSRIRAGRGKPAEWGGMSMFVNNAVRGDDPRLETVYANFEANLRDIVRVARGAGAATLLCTVASNVRDCAPFLSLHGPGLASSDLQAWERLHRRGMIEWVLGESDAARADLLRALRMDPQYADTSYMLGSIDLGAGRTDAARQELSDAEHWDALRFRPDARINEIIRRVAGDFPSGVSLLDASTNLGSDPRSTAPPAGRGLFFEHVHLDWDGNYALALSMAQRSEAALFGSGAGRPAWLGPNECAAALGYSAHERLGVLQHIGTIVQNPPFTNQLTYPEDEARLARDLALARSDRDNPALQETARRILKEAVASDRDNADLAKIAEDVDDDLGDVEGALAEARRAQDLEPRNFALVTDEAIKLSRLGRYGEAERILKSTAASSTARDRAAMAPAFADLYTRMRRFDEGRRYLDREVAGRPSDMNLRLARGRLSRLAGDAAAAEGEFRSILAIEPGNQAALEALVSLLAGAGRQADAEKACLEAVDSQPRNLANNLRASIICDQRGDAAGFIRCLLAAERSGPVTAALEVQLARRLFALQRLDDTLEHLGEARRISLYEGDPAATDSIARAIRNLRAQMR